MFAIVQWLLFIAALIVSYVMWIRPILHERPELKALYDVTDSYYYAFVLRFQGIKTKLVAGIGMAGSAIFTFWDLILPHVINLWSSFEPYAYQIDLSPIIPEQYQKYLPLVMMVMFWLIGKFKTMADERAKEQLEEAKNGS